MVPMVYQYRPSFYQWYLGNTIGTNDNANGVIGSPNGTIGKMTNGTIGRTPKKAARGFQMVPLVILPMVPLVANGIIGLPMVPLGEPVVQLALPLVPMVLPMVPLVEP